MLEALATLVFLSSIWLVVTVGAWTAVGSHRKILAALTGRDPAMPVRIHPVAMRLRPRTSSRPAIRAQAQPQWRVAA